MVVFAVAANVGNALSPTLLVHEPVLLLELAPRIRYLVLVSPRLDIATYLAVPLVRQLAPAIIWFLFGRRYGDRTVRWLEEKSGPRAARPLLWIERQFGRARYAVVALLPATNVVWLLAGSSGMHTGVFAGITAASLIVRYLLLRALADVFSGAIIDVTDWVGNNQLWLTALSIASVVVFVWWGRRTGHTDLESVDEIAEELEET